MKSIFHPNKASVPNYLVHSVIWNGNLSNPLQLILFLLSHAHTLIILLWIQTQLPQISSNELLAVSINRIMQVLSCKDVYSFGNDNFSTTAFLFALISCYFLALGLMFLFSLLCSVIRSISFRPIVCFVVLIGQVQLALGFWLINSFLMQYISVENLEEEEEEGLSGRGALLALAIILVIANYLVTFFFAMFSHDPFLSRNFLAAHSTGAQFITFLFKAATAPVVFMSQDLTFRNWFLVVVSGLILAGKYYFLVDRFPYYKYKTMKLSITFATVNMLVALVNLIVRFIVIDKTLSLTSVLYSEAVLTSLAVKFALTFFNRNVLSFIAMKKEHIKTPKDVMKKLFALSFLFRKTKFNFHEDERNTYNMLRLSGLLSVEMKDPQDILFIPKEEEYSIDGSNGSSLVNEMAKIYREYEGDMVKTLLEDSVKRFKEDNHIRVLYIDFCLQCNQPYQITILHLTELKKCTGMYRSIAINLHDMLQDSVDNFFRDHAGKVLDLKRFVQQTDISSNFIAAIQSTATLQIKLWRNYLKSTVKMNDIWEKSKSLEVAADKIDIMWKKEIIHEKAFASLLYRVYSSYLSLIRGCPMLAQQVNQRYHLFRHEQLIENAKDHTLFAGNNLNDPNILTICSSIAKVDIGRVVSVSSNFSELVGYAKEEIIGLDINTILPNFIARVHNRMLLEHLDIMETQKKSTRLYKTVPSYVKHREGHIIPCEVYISVHPYITELPTYLVLVRLRDFKYEQILINDQGIMEGFTEEIMEILNPSLQRKHHLSALCLNAFDVENFLVKNSHQVNQRHLSVTNGIGTGAVYERDMQTPLFSDTNERMTLFFHPLHNSAEPKTERKVLKYRVEICVFFFDKGTYFSLHLFKDKTKYDDILRVVPTTKRAIAHEADDKSSVMDDVPEEQTPFPKVILAGDQTPAARGEPQSYGVLDSPSGISDLLASPAPSVRYKESQFRRGSVNSGQYTGGGIRSLYGGGTGTNDNNTAKFGSMSERDIMQASSRSDQMIRRVGQFHNRKSPMNNVIKIIKLQIDNKDTNSKSSKKVTAKLENAFHYIPEPAGLNKFYIVEILLILLSSIPLLVFGFQANRELDLVHNSVQVLSQSINRLVRMSDLYGYATGAAIAERGIVSEDRYYSYGYTNTAADSFKSFIPAIIDILDTTNKDVIAYVPKLKTAKVQEMYEKNVPIYQTLDDGSGIGIYRWANLFDTVDNLVSEGKKMVSLNLPYNSSNPHWLFIHNNSINEAMVIGEESLTIISNDNETKITSLTDFVYVTIGVIAAAGIFVFALFHFIFRGFLKERTQFITIFLHFQDHQIKEHIHRVEKFAKTIDPNSVQIRKLESLPGVDEKRAKPTYLKKKADTKGVNMRLYMLYLATFCLVVGLFLAHPVLAVRVKRGCDGIINKINLAAQSNFNFHETCLLFGTIYVYVLEDASTYLREKPISVEYVSIFNKMTTVQDFIVGQLLDTEKGLGKNEELKDTVMSNLCDMIKLTDPVVERNCMSLGGGAATRGLIGLNSFTLQALGGVKSFYDNSDKSVEAASAALSMKDLVDLEVLYTLTYQAYLKIDNILQQQLYIDFEDLKNSIQQLGLSFCIVYLLFGGYFSWKLRKSLVKEMVDWRKLLRQVPYIVACENKHFRAYVQRTSGNPMININN